MVDKPQANHVSCEEAYAGVPKFHHCFEVYEGGEHAISELGLAATP